MKKNVASQSIGAQMIAAADGSDFTGAVTVYITGDNGTQTIGSVGSGICTHEGNGYHSYAPSQAETNYDHIAFTFKATGAVTASIQLYTMFPQTGDMYAARPTNFSSLSIDVNGRVDVSKIAGTAQTARDIGASVLLSSGTAAGQISLSSGLVTLAGVTHTGAVIPTVTTLTNLPAVTSNWLTAAGIAASALNGKGDWLNVAGVAAAVWNASISSYGTSGSYGELIEVYLDVPVSTVGGGSLTNSSIASAVWNEALAGHATAGTAGAALSAAGTAGDPWLTPLPGAYASGTAGYIIGNYIAAIKTKTDFLPSATAGASGGLMIAGTNAATTVNITGNITGNLTGSVGSLTGHTPQTGDAYARLGAPAGASHAADVAAVKVDTAAIKVKTDSLTFTGAGVVDANLVAIKNSATHATAFDRAVAGNVIGTVGAGSTTTSVVSSALTPAGSVSTQFKGRIMTFADNTTTAALRGQSTDITGSTASANPTFATSALTTAPVSGDTFSIT